MLTCSAALATGLTSQKGNLVVQVYDTDIRGNVCTVRRVQLTIPKKGNRYLNAPSPGPENLVPILNEKVIGVVGFGRFVPVSTPYPGTPKYITQDELMRVSNSA